MIRNRILHRAMNRLACTAALLMLLAPAFARGPASQGTAQATSGTCSASGPRQAPADPAATTTRATGTHMPGGDGCCCPLLKTVPLAATCPAVAVHQRLSAAIATQATASMTDAAHASGASCRGPPRSIAAHS